MPNRLPSNCMPSAQSAILEVIVDSSSNSYGEEGFENGDQDASYQAASQILAIKFGKTSPSELFPGTRTLCRFRRAQRKSWPECRERQSLSICFPNHEGSSPLRLFCRRLHRRVPAPRWRPENRPTSQLPSARPAAEKRKLSGATSSAALRADGSQFDRQSFIQR